MPALLLTVALLSTPDDEPFLTTGGIEHVCIQSSHATLFGIAASLAVRNNTQADTTALDYTSLAMPLVTSGISLIEAHLFHPTAVQAFEAGLMGIAGFMAGTVAADAFVLARGPTFNPNWLWPTRIVAGAIGHLIGGAIPVVLGGEHSLAWHSGVTAIALAIGLSVVFLFAFIPGNGSSPAIVDPARSAEALIPFVLGSVAAVGSRALYPDVL